MPHINTVLGESQGLYDSGQPTYAQFSPTTERALTGIEDRAAAGSPVFDMGRQGLMDTMSGQYLTPDSNPYLRSYFDAASGGVQDRINAEFSKAGRYGSGAHAGTTARELGNLAAKMYAPAYEAERNRMFGAIGQAPNMASAEYGDLQNMLTAGYARDAKAQQGVDDPYNQIMRYLSVIRGVPQGTESFSRTKDQIESNPGVLGTVGTLGNLAMDAYSMGMFNKDFWGGGNSAPSLSMGWGSMSPQPGMGGTAGYGWG